MRGMTTALSGLRAAQTGLSVIGHNVANSSRTDYTRQLLVQGDFSYQNNGNSAIGSGKMQIGLGTQNSQIRQIRNKFYDINYREENSAGSYYARKYNAGEEINNIIGELQSEYKAQDTIDGIWNSLNELTHAPDGVETRQSFIQSCVGFLDKMKDISQKLFDYQMNLNEQVKGEVDKVNDIVSKIKDINVKIQEIEAGGKKANDLQDTRNSLIDELSSIIEIDVKEKAIPESGSVIVDIYVGGTGLLTDNIQNTLGLQYTSGEFPFYEPVFTTNKNILAVGTTDSRLYPNLNQALGTDINAERGSLKGLLVSRGSIMANFMTPDADVGEALIPNVQKKIDRLVHEVVTMLNESVAPPHKDLSGTEGIPIFVRKAIAGDGGYDAAGRPTQVQAEDLNGLNGNPPDKRTWYTTSNIEINPEILSSDGYNKLAFSSTGDKGDTSVLTGLVKDWKENRQSLDDFSIDGYYKGMITEFAVEINTYKQSLESRLGTIDLAENKRFSMSGVSLDEELSSMLKYQHAYNSASKMINVLDSMLDKVINGTGRVGA